MHFKILIHRSKFPWWVLGDSLLVFFQNDLRLHHNEFQYNASLHVNLTQGGNPIEGKKCSWQFVHGLERQTALKNIKAPKERPESVSSWILLYKQKFFFFPTWCLADVSICLFPIKVEFPIVKHLSKHSTH